MAVATLADRLANVKWCLVVAIAAVRNIFHFEQRQMSPTAPPTFESLGPPHSLLRIRDFLSAEEEQEIVHDLCEGRLSTRWERVKDRRVVSLHGTLAERSPPCVISAGAHKQHAIFCQQMHFGHNYLYSSFSIDEDAPPFPEFAKRLVDRARTMLDGHARLPPTFDQLTIQEYQPRSGIRKLAR